MIEFRDAPAVRRKDYIVAVAVLDVTSVRDSCQVGIRPADQHRKVALIGIWYFAVIDSNCPPVRVVASLGRRGCDDQRKTGRRECLSTPRFDQARGGSYKRRPQRNQEQTNQNSQDFNSLEVADYVGGPQSYGLRKGVTRVWVPTW